MNAIGLALKHAGYEYATAEDRKFALAAEAWAKHPGPNAGLARKSFIMNALGGQETWSMVQDYDKHTLGLAVSHLLNKTEPKRKPDTGVRSVGGGHRHRDTHQTAAPATQNRYTDTDAMSVGGGQESRDTHDETAPATPSRDDARPQAERLSEPATALPAPKNTAPAAPPPFGQYINGTEESRAREKTAAAERLKILSDKHKASTAMGVKIAIRMCRLDTVMIGGRPIGDCMVADVKKWAESRLTDMRAAGRDARFAMILVANLESNKVIRDHWKDPDEVDAQYAKAEAGYAA